jgi:hypothetical protein
MLAQVAGITVDDDTIASVVAVLGSARRPVEMDRARIDRRIRELALEHAAGDLADDAYLARLKALREARDAIAEGSGIGVPAQRAIEWLRARRVNPAGRRTEGEGRPDARHLRADRGRGTRDRRGSPHVGGLRARTGAGAAGKGCNGAPDRTRTCDLWVRNPTLYPLSYRRASGQDTLCAAAAHTGVRRSP